LLDRDTPPEHILIETSGLALPKPLVQAFAWPEIRTRTTVDGVLTVIDGAAVAAGLFAADPEAVARQRAADPALAHDNPLEEVFADQLACADLVILNKTDLIAPERLTALRREIEAELRPGLKLVSARQGRVPPQVALGLTAAAENDLASRPSIHELEAGHDHDDFESFVVTAGSVEDGNEFLVRLRSAIGLHDVLRVKGFVDLPRRDRRRVYRGRSRPEPSRHCTAVERRYRNRAPRLGTEAAPRARSAGTPPSARSDPTSRPQFFGRPLYGDGRPRAPGHRPTARRHRLLALRGRAARRNLPRRWHPAGTGVRG